MNKTNSFWEKFACNDGIHEVIIDDDGRVCYAYLLESGEICGDVWLYNRCQPPHYPEWERENEPPYANTIGYIDENMGFIPPFTIDDFSISWKTVEDNKIKAVISINGIIHATCSPGDKPGYCRLAYKAGPLAKPICHSV